MDAGKKFYFFEYDRPGKKPGRTRWRMTIEHAREFYGDGYRPIMGTEEVRPSTAFNQFDSFKPYAPGTGPAHWFKKEPDDSGA